MKNSHPTPQKFESTYALIVRSEERERSASETVAFALLIMSALFSSWQITRQPFTVPTNLQHGRTVQVQAVVSPAA